jgi:hypothetical protein
MYYSNKKRPKYYRDAVVAVDYQRSKKINFI